MNSPMLFYETYLEALRDDVTAIGGAKAVGQALFPEKRDPIAARNALNDRLNDNRRERLTDEQERYIMRKARDTRGFSAALAFICDDTGFERPKPLNPRDEATELQRKFVEAVNVAETFAKRLERLNVDEVKTAMLRAVDAGVKVSVG